MEKIYAAIRDLTEYALATELIAEEDVIYTVNSLLGALGIDDYPGDRAEIIGGAAALDRAKIEDGTLLEGILAVILDYASEDRRRVRGHEGSLRYEDHGHSDTQTE